MKCKDCKTANPQGAIYCGKCGRVMLPFKKCFQGCFNLLKKLLLTAFILGCTLLIFGIFLANRNEKINKTLKYDVRVPSVVKAGEKFDIEFTITNIGETPLPIQGLVLGENILGSDSQSSGFALFPASYSSPPFVMTRIKSNRGGTEFYYPLKTIKPQEKISFKIALQARKKGVYEDEVKVTFGMGSYTTSQKIKIKVI